ncbi:hypothetical protein Egran_02722 [Elaphomyces granulatus]|uniref:Sorting nexin MVP1 n=1 Tax=Elaphomyces granulatus TaxID=519963 RepID=A0A232LZC4_9EURO|nr:hypothetical protein Egran_02722 [Elaphomyces granulatus]
MSLFGDSPEAASEANSSHVTGSASLFADDPIPGSRAGSALFADEPPSSDSPWDFPPPKRTGRQDVVKTLLPTTDVPESYIDAYDLILDSGDRVAGLSLTNVREILTTSGLKSGDQVKILNLVIPNGLENPGGLGRNEFNVLLALVGLSQEGEEVTFDAVDERRKRLPQPKIPYLDQIKRRSTPSNPGLQERPTTPRSRAPQQSNSGVRRARQDSVGAAESDPWASPELHQGHNHATAGGTEPVLNGFGSVRTAATNGWSNKASGYRDHSDSQNVGPSNGEAEEGPSSTGSGWDGYNSTSSAAFGNPGQSSLGGFGLPEEDQGGSNTPRRSLGGGKITGSQVEEVITITMVPEKEGMFMFQHRNYEVKSPRRGSTVIRRYSDFVWLLDCLQKRYPFRQLPLLPPKRVAVNGTHLAADSNSFLEKRRRGLVRFANTLVRHPVLNQEQLVVMFLTVPTELSVWRKQATISVQEEFAGKALPPNLEDSLASNLTETFDVVRTGVKRSAEIYINLCTLLERLTKRNEGLAADQLRFSLALKSLTEAVKAAYAVDTSDVPLLNEGIRATARHLSVSQNLLEDEARAWNDGVLEDMKRQRDSFVSMRDLFDRRDRYARDSIPQLERRIESNERKLQDLRTRPQGAKPGEIEKVEEAIMRDKASIVQQHARGVFIKECIRDELIFFQHSQYHISRLHQDWSLERVKYTELQANNWRALSEEVEGMPTGD